MLKNPLNRLKNALPLLGWLSSYNFEVALADVIAGITAGLTLIPHSIAYAVLAGLPPQYGLYSSLCGGFVYALFGTVPELNIAPTALLSLLTLTYSSRVNFGIVPASVLLCFSAGIIEVCCGFLHLGFLVDFISIPAIVGLTSAASILIASSQLRSVFGLPGSGSGSFVGAWKYFFQNIPNINFWDTGLSICCCFVLLSLRKLQDYGTPPACKTQQNEGQKRGRFKVFLWFLCVSRNALVILISTITVVIFANSDQVFSFSGNVQPGLPDISLPPLEVVENNRTFTFLDMTSELGTGIFVIPFIAIVANVAIAKSFTQCKMLNASQEMVAVGFCNIFGSFVSSMPVNGSFSLSVISNVSGVRTPIAGIYTSLMVILSLTFLMPFCSYIPRATLGSLIICAVIFMIEINLSKKIWKLNKIDILPLSVTFFACLFLGIEIGVLLGVSIDVLLLLLYISRPQIDVQRVTIQGKEYVKIIPLGSVFYPSAEFFRERIMKNEIVIDKCREGNVLIIDCSKFTKTDFTTAKCFGVLAEELQKTNKTIAFLRISTKLSKLLSKTCRNCIFAFTDEILIEILKERRYSNILDSYKSIKVEHENTINGSFSVVIP